MATFGGLAFGLAGGLLLLGFGAVVSHKLGQQDMVVSPEESRPGDSTMERARLVLHELSKDKNRATPMLSAAASPSGLPALAGSGGRRAGWTVPSSPLFANCVDQLMKRDTDVDPIKTAAQRLALRFSLNELDARGLVFDTLVSVCQQKATETDELAGYFARSLRNAAINFRKRFLRAGRQCSIEIVPAIRYEADGDQSWDFSDHLATHEEFCRLPALDQELIKERVVMGRSFVEIGALYDMSDNAAQKAFNRAMKRLSELSEKK